MFDPTLKHWIVGITLQASASEFVLPETDWKVLVDPGYPLGDIGVYPSTTNGIITTFNHQIRNLELPSQSWRTGKLCLDEPFGAQRAGNLRDPIGDPEERLPWHIDRALAWLDAASSGSLIAAGDPFELPDRSLGIESDFKFRIIHDESPSTFPKWSSRIGSVGTIRFRTSPGLKRVLIARTFIDGNGAVVRSWSGRIGDPDAAVLGFWWLWPDPIVLPPWFAPTTWGDIRKIGRNAQIDVDRELRNIARRIRGAKDPALLLIGYPIPKRVGEPPSEVHWDAYLLPKLAANKPPNGFRNNETAWWMHDRSSKLGDATKPPQIPAENWNQERLQARGRLPEHVRSHAFAVVGVGALGAAIAEALVRAGVTKIALVDPDALTAGNVCRHLATLNDVGDPKVDVVGRRLFAVSPHVEVHTMKADLPATERSLLKELAAYDVLVDCTASNDALEALASAWCPVPRVYISLSMGFGGRRLFSFRATGHSFPAIEFKKQIEPWLVRERELWATSGEVLEGAGCWSPLFPARFDDVLIAAGVGVKEIERLLSADSQQGGLNVFELDAIAPISMSAKDGDDR